jgi:hypothetical protein
VLRDRYKEDIESITNELNVIGFLLQEKSQDLFNIALSDIEANIFSQQYYLVEWSRKIRGIEKLTRPIDFN